MANSPFTIKGESISKMEIGEKGKVMFVVDGRVDV